MAEKAVHGNLTGRRSSTGGSDRDRVIDRQRRQRAIVPGQQYLRCGRPPPSYGGWKSNRWRKIFGQRILEGHRREVVEEVLLEKPPKRVRCRELTVGGRHRQQSVAVDGLEENRNFRGGSRHHGGEEECRILVGHYNRRIGSQSLEQPSAGAPTRLHKWQIGHAATFEPSRRIGHAVCNETVEPVARP
jgi:hypothetical protein